MATSPGNLPYPDPSASVDVPRDFKALALALDVRVPIIGGAGAMLGPNYGASTPNITEAQVKVQTLNTVTDANGVQRCTWKTPFTTAILWVGVLGVFRFAGRADLSVPGQPRLCGRQVSRGK
jgi:hypothetical protein